MKIFQLPSNVTQKSTISSYQDLEIEDFPGNNAWRFLKFQVTLPRGLKFQSIVTWRFFFNFWETIARNFFWVLLLEVSAKFNKFSWQNWTNFQVFLPRHFSTSEYQHLEVENFRVSLPGGFSASR